ncbi:hypothetical protein PG997_000351 [Apiospora hydei]|uniref:Apple domain-containing protein n=1 Tax=Apiospora hydei TaxID=1337664 RepID=A0ABR1XAC7_9PEZI
MATDKYLDLSQRRHQQPDLEPSTSHPYLGIEVQSDSAQGYTQPGNAQQQWAQAPSASLISGEKNTPPTISDNHHRRVLGLRVPVFWGLLVALILVVAGAIGGGIGGGLATQGHNNNINQDSLRSTKPSSDAGETISNPPAQQTTTTTEGTITIALPIVQPSITPVDGGCPRINGTRYTPRQKINGTSAPITLQGQTQAQSFVQLCDTNFPEGDNDPGVHDIDTFITATFEQCMTLCADWNRQYQLHGEDRFCMAVSIVKIGKFP